MKIGPDSPLVQALVQWVDKGYRQLAQGGECRFPYCSWRYFIPGGAENRVVFGLGKESCDTLGRPYPLWIAAVGPVADWQEHWHLMPLALDDAWRQLEVMVTRRNPDPGSLRSQLSGLRAPRPDWKTFASLAGCLPGQTAEDRIGPAGSVVEAATQGEVITSRIDGRQAVDPLKRACGQLARLRRQQQGLPNAVFIGGRPDATFLMVFYRPLTSADFARLWLAGGINTDPAETLDKTEDALGGDQTDHYTIESADANDE